LATHSINNSANPQTQGGAATGYIHYTQDIIILSKLSKANPLPVATGLSFPTQDIIKLDLFFFFSSVAFRHKESGIRIRCLQDVFLDEIGNVLKVTGGCDGVVVGAFGVGSEDFWVCTTDGIQLFHV